MPKKEPKNQISTTKEIDKLPVKKEIAVIKTGGKQYIVSEGKSLKVEKLDEKEGSTVEFSDILNGKNVVAKIIEHGKSKKVRGRIFINKVRSSRFPRGHRQQFTALVIEKIA